MKTKTQRGPLQQSAGVVSAVIVVILLFGVVLPKALIANDAYRAMREGWSYDTQYLVHPAFRMILVTLGWLLVRKLTPHKHTVKLGLLVGWKPGLFGFGLGFVCTLPMLALGMLGSFNEQVFYRYIGYTTLMPGLTEEIFYRAFTFGLLVRVANWKLWPAAIFTGIIFGLTHVDFSPTDGETILGQLGPWIAMIALGGVLYAWLYERANWNLWIVIALHFGMNLWWDLFDLTSSPLGGIGATVSRILAVGLAILFVVHYEVLRKDRTTIRA